MIFDEFAHLSIDEQIMKGYERLPAHIRQAYEDLATERGVPLASVLVEALDVGLDLLRDPITFRTAMEKRARAAQPCGIDPQLGKDGEP